MKIAFDARSLFHGGTGDVTYFRALLGALARITPEDELHLYYREFDSEREQLAVHHANITTHGLRFPIGWLWNQCALAPALHSDGMALLHAQYLLPRFAPRPTVVTIHDITFRLFPEWFPPRACKLMNFLIPSAAHNATRIITGSQCAKNDMVREFGVPPERIVVTPYAAAPQFSPRDPVEAHRRVRTAFPSLSGPFIVGIGLRGTRKNIGVVLRAMLSLVSRGAWPTGTKLALAGTREQFPDAEIARLENDIVFLGFVPDDLLPELYGAALASVYPSLYEGFGLPVLEAMACGCPVLSSDTSSLPEVAGDAAVLLPPQDETAWADAIEKIIGDENHRASLCGRGILRAAEFSWERTARETQTVYRTVLAGG